MGIGRALVSDFLRLNLDLAGIGKTRQRVDANVLLLTPALFTGPRGELLVLIGSVDCHM